MITRRAITRNLALAARVQRYHTWPVIHRESVGEHTLSVLRIYREVFGLSSLTVVNYIIDHDLTEIVTGDLPFPVKSRNPVLKSEMDRIETTAKEHMGLIDYQISAEERRRVKVCDLLQMWEFGKIEDRMGNMFAMTIIGDTAATVMELVRDTADLALVTKWMQSNDL